MTHAIEGYVSVDWSPTRTRARSRRCAVRENLERAVQTPEDEEASGNMLRGRQPRDHDLAGSTHAMSHPFGAHYASARGRERDQPAPHRALQRRGRGRHANRYRDVNELFGSNRGAPTRPSATLATQSHRDLGRLGLPTRLSEVGVPESGIPALVEGAMGDGTTLLNPREPSEEDYEELFKQAL